MSLKSVVRLIFILLLLFHFIILFIHGGLLFLQKTAPSIPVVLYFAMLLTFCAVFSAGMIWKPLRENKLFPFFQTSAVILMAAGLVWMLMDAPEVINDYSNEDVIYKTNGSYNYLTRFDQTHAEVLKKANHELNETSQDRIWEQIAEYRHAINALDRFDVICDLPPGTRIDMEIPFLNYTSLKEIGEIYRKNFLLTASQEKGFDAAENLCRLHRVARKGMADSTVLINKIIFSSLSMQTMDSAYAATLTPGLDEKIINLLKESFTVLESKELSLNRVVTAEYLMVKNAMENQLSPGSFLNSVHMVSGTIQTTENTFSPVSYLVYYFGFKPHRSLMEIKEYYSFLINTREDFPDRLVRANQYFEEYRQHPPIKNMAGWILNTIAIPDFKRFYDRLENARIKSHLLSLVLHRKLKEPMETKEIYPENSNPYRKENGILRHPGRDGRFDSDDDIILGVPPG